MQAQDLLRELRRVVEELRAFNDIGRTLTSTVELDEVLRIIMQKVSELLDAGNWSLLLADGAGTLHWKLAVGEGAEARAAQSIRHGQGVAGWVAARGQPVLLDRPHSDPRFDPAIDELTSPVRSLLAVPLRSKGRTLGVIELANGPHRHDFTPDDLRTLGTLADYAAIAIENARNFERIRELTLIDDHTGLFNARHLYHSLDVELARARRFGRGFALLFFDLDHFKQVNDRHGHQAGSAVLKEVGDVLRGAIRATDIPVRYGGDEFVVLLPEADAAQARAAAERVRNAINGTAFLRSRGLAVRVTASFGVATYPTDGETAEELLRLADGAMYRVKESSRDAIALAAEVC